MTVRHLIPAALVALGLAASAAAQQPPLKVATLDTERILVTSQTGKKALADLKKLQEQREGEIRAKAQELKDLQTKISEGRLSLAQDKLAELQKQFEEKEIQLRRFRDDATRELNKKRDEILAQIDKQVMPVINQLGKELGFTLIFRKFESGLIYADEAIDITDSIIQRLDGAAPKAGK
jgi:outer membrane protein